MKHEHMLHSVQGFQSLNIKGHNFALLQMQKAMLRHNFGNQNHSKTII